MNQFWELLRSYTTRPDLVHHNTVKVKLILAMFQASAFRSQFYPG